MSGLSASDHVTLHGNIKTTVATVTKSDRHDHLEPPWCGFHSGSIRDQGS